MTEQLPTPESIPSRWYDLREQGFESIVVAADSSLSQLDLNPLDVPLDPVPVLGDNPLGWSTTSFVELFHSMDTHVFGGRGLTMPNWVLVDHALLSSGLVTLACRPERFDDIGHRYRLSEEERYVLASLAVEATDKGFDGPIPLASYCGAPTAARGRRVGWSLCSVVPRSGLGFLVKTLALTAYRAQTLSGTTQYDNVALRVHTKYGAARLLAATIDIHTVPHSLVYETDFRSWLDGTAAKPSDAEPSFLVSAGDSALQAEMQRKIEAGTHKFSILPPGMIFEEGERLVPVLETQLTDPERDA